MPLRMGAAASISNSPRSSIAEGPGEGTEMTQEKIERIGQTETQFEQGYDDRWRDVPYRDDASESWQRGWKEANLELSGDDSIEF